MTNIVPEDGPDLDDFDNDETPTADGFSWENVLGQRGRLSSNEKLLEPKLELGDHLTQHPPTSGEPNGDTTIDSTISQYDPVYNHLTTTTNLAFPTNNRDNQPISAINGSSDAEAVNAQELLTNAANILKITPSGETILRFSRLFAPTVIEEIYPGRSTTIVIPKRQSHEIDTKDDCHEFRSRDLEASPSEGDEGDWETMAKQRLLTDPRFGVGHCIVENVVTKWHRLRLHSALFEPVQQVDWEQDVKWDAEPLSQTTTTEDNENQPDNPEENLSWMEQEVPLVVGDIGLQLGNRDGNKIRFQVERRHGHHRLFHLRNASPPPTMMALLLTDWGMAPTSKYVPKTKREAPTSATISNPYRNVDLMGTDWANHVVWDSEPRPPPRLLLDVNDGGMIFNDDDNGMEDVARVSEQVDKRALHERFNVSQDDSDLYGAYRDDMGAVVGKTGLQHALFAKNLIDVLFPTDRSPRQWATWHRPQLNLEQIASVRITPPTAFSFPMANRKFVPRRLRDVSARDGDIVLMEYIEENPLLIQTTGMATELVTFYRQRTHNDTYVPTVPHGAVRIVSADMDDETPFFGKIRNGFGTTALNNNMFSAPIAQHDAATTDFLMVFAGKMNTSFVLQPLPALYVAGQIQPKMEVPGPNSRAASSFMKRRLTVYMHRRLEEQGAIQISEVFSAFPGQSETAIRAKLKEVAEFQRSGDLSGWWTKRSDKPETRETALWDMVTPEAMCAYERMEAGRQTLRERVGIELLATLTSTERVFIARMSAEHPLKKPALYIEQQTRMTPWNLTNNFNSAVKGICLLRLNGPCNPIGSGAGLCYLRAPTRSEPDPIEEKIGPVSQLTGTNKDLRKLDMNGLRDVLLSFGVPSSQIDKLLRWERVDLVRLKATEAARDGHENEWTRFARSQRNTYRALSAQFVKDAQRLFEAQCEVLARAEPPANVPLDGDDTVDEMEEWARDLESMMESEELELMKKSKKPEKPDDTEDAAEYRRWLASQKPQSGQISPGSIAPAIPERSGSTQKKKVLRQRLRKTVTTLDSSTGTTTMTTTMIDDPELIASYIADAADGGSKFSQICAEKAERISPQPMLGKARMRLCGKKRRRGRTSGGNELVLPPRNFKKPVSALELTIGKKRGRPKGSTKDRSGVVGQGVEKKTSTVRCSRCKQIGHTKSNSRCPELAGSAMAINSSGNIVLTLTPGRM